MQLFPVTEQHGDATEMELTLEPFTLPFALKVFDRLMCILHPVT